MAFQSTAAQEPPQTVAPFRDFWRVQDPVSGTCFNDNGFFSRDRGRTMEIFRAMEESANDPAAPENYFAFSGWQQMAVVLLSHLMGDWTEPSPFISVFADYYHTMRYADRLLRAGRDKVRIVHIRIESTRTNVVVRDAKRLAVALGLNIDWEARLANNGEHLFVQRIPIECIRTITEYLPFVSPLAGGGEF